MVRRRLTEKKGPCWDGYERVPGTKEYEKGSCRKKGSKKNETDEVEEMEELQELNPKKDTATNAMCTFLAINTSSVQFILPATVVALMGAAANQIFITTILATGMSTIAAIFAVKFFEKLNHF